MCNIVSLNWIEINKDILNDNIKKIKRTYGENQKVGAMVKANAYGHGLLEVAECIQDEVETFYVSAADEAICLFDYFKINKYDWTNRISKRCCNTFKNLKNKEFNNK